MKILVIAPTSPFPANSGERIRIAQCMDALRRNHEVTCACLVSPEDGTPVLANVQFRLVTRKSPSKMTAVLKSCASPLPYPCGKYWSTALHREVHKCIGETSFDLIWVHFAAMSQYLEGLDLSGRKVVLDEHNNDVLYWQTFAKSNALAHKCIGSLNAMKAKRYLRRVLGLYTHQLCVSRRDMSYGEQLVEASTRQLLVPNGVDVAHFAASTSSNRQRGSILFCGSLDVTMNQDAVRLFCGEILPLVRERVPEAALTVCGRNPPQSIRRLSCGAIHVTGSVPDVRPYYQQASVAVAPFRYGGGTKLKILEALASRTPVVSTSCGCQGIDVVAGRHVLIADHPDDFADAVVKVLRDRMLCESLAEAGFALAQKYGWQSIYESAVEQILAS